MEKTTDQIIEQVVGIFIALALASVAIWLGALFLLGWELFLLSRRRKMVDEGRQVFQTILHEEGMTVEVDNALKAAIAGGMQFNSESGQEQVKWPGVSG